MPAVVLGEGFPHPLENGLGRSRIGGGKDHGKFIPPDPGDDVLAAEFLQHLSDSSKAIIARLVSLGVIDLLEAIHVRHDDADRKAPPRLQPVKLRLEKGPVVETRQVVPVTEIAETFLRLLALRDIDEKSPHADRLARHG